MSDPADGGLPQGRRYGEERLRLALDAGSLGVWEWDAATGTVIWDERMEDLAGVERESFAGTFDAYVELLHPDDRSGVMTTIESAMETGERFSVEHRIVRADGEVRWIRGHGQPVFVDGEARGLIGVSTDITVEQRTEEHRRQLLENEAAAREEAEAARARLEYLADAGQAISRPVGLAERLDQLTRLAVPRFADAAGVYLLVDGRPELIALHHRDPDRKRSLEGTLQRFPVQLESEVGIGAAIRDQTTLWLPLIDSRVLERAARSEEHLAELRSVGLRTAVAVPLVVDGTSLGAMAFVTVDDRELTEDDVAVVEELCTRAAVHIQNAQLFEMREFERAAHRFEARLLQALFDASNDGMLAVGIDGEVLAHNRRFLELWGFDEELVAAGDEALLRAGRRRIVDTEGFLEKVHDAYVHQRHIHDQLVLTDGRVIDRHGIPVFDDAGRHLGFTWTFRDITRELAQQAEIRAAGERSATLARTLQQSLLPPSLPSPDSVEFAGHYHPALEGVDVGGDFYDVFRVGDGWLLAIGDVCGKGAAAAALTALARHTIRAAAMHSSDPATILAELNTAMLSHADESAALSRFATVCCARLVPVPGGMSADIACGGHPLPLVLRADGTVRTVGTPGTLLGVFAEARVDTVTTHLDPHDTLVAVTDGVLEARNDRGELFETEGLSALLSTLLGGSAAEICDATGSAALDHQHGVAHDDIAVLVAQVR